MAYVHCHHCDWNQDDFWEFGIKRIKFAEKTMWLWGYNPIKNFLEHFKSNLKPRRVEFDKFYAKDVGWKRHDPFSWWLIWYEFRRMVRQFRQQQWWTNASWQKSIRKNNGHWPPCPRCGQHKLDID